MQTVIQFKLFPALSSPFSPPNPTQDSHTTTESKRRTNPRPIPAEINTQSPPPPPNFELPVHLPGPIARRAYRLRKPAGDGVLTVDALGRLLRLEDELLEAVVGALPGVPPGLPGSHALRKTVKIASPEGLDGHRRTVAHRGGEEPENLGFGRDKWVPWKAGGHDRHGNV